MTEIRTLAAHDPLPDGPAVVLMRRFEEDDPRQAMMELIVLHRGGSEETRRLLTQDGKPLPWDKAAQIAEDEARRAHLTAVYHLDRTSGPREREIMGHGGDHTVGMETLDDDDLEDGEHGSDLRDSRMNGAPRRF